MTDPLPLPQNVPIAMLKHEDLVFEDQLVYATGHHYKNCDFVRCTIVIKGFPFAFDGGKITDCVWHIDTIVHDRSQATALTTLLNTVVVNSIGIPQMTPRTVPQSAAPHPAEQPGQPVVKRQKKKDKKKRWS